MSSSYYGNCLILENDGGSKTVVNISGPDIVFASYTANENVSFSRDRNYLFVSSIAPTGNPERGPSSTHTSPGDAYIIDSSGQQTFLENTIVSYSIFSTYLEKLVVIDLVKGSVVGSFEADDISIINRGSFFQVEEVGSVQNLSHI